MNGPNDEGATPLSRACRWGHADCAALLVSAGADTAKADSAGKTPADWATAKGHDACLVALQKPMVRR